MNQRRRIRASLECIPKKSDSRSGGKRRLKKEAARSIIPGKNPKTQRDVQSGRLVCRDAAKKTPDTLGVKSEFYIFPKFFLKGLQQVMRGKSVELVRKSDFSPSPSEIVDYSAFAGSIVTRCTISDTIFP